VVSWVFCYDVSAFGNFCSQPFSTPQAKTMLYNGWCSKYLVYCKGYTWCVVNISPTHAL
jgi:hypothetical protein